MRYKCGSAASALTSFYFFSECLFFSISCLLYGKYLFKLSARLQTRDVNGRSPKPFTGRWHFFFLAEKQKQEIFRSRMWACIFRVKWCIVGMHNAITRSGLLICWFKKICSNNFFYTFVIMQLVLLNICVGQRWNVVMKIRLRLMPQLQRKEKLVSQVKWGHFYGRTR